MSLKKLASALFFSAYVFCTNEVEFFESTIVPEKMHVDHTLKGTLRSEATSPSCTPDVPLSTRSPIPQAAPSIQSKVPLLVVSEQVSFPISHDTTATDATVSLLERGNIEYQKYTLSVHHKSIIPWRVVKDITLLPAKTDRSIPSKTTRPSVEEHTWGIAHDTVEFVAYMLGNPPSAHFIITHTDIAIVPINATRLAVEQCSLHQCNSYTLPCSFTLASLPFLPAQPTTSHHQPIHQKTSFPCVTERVEYPSCPIPSSTLLAQGLPRETVTPTFVNHTPVPPVHHRHAPPYSFAFPEYTLFEQPLSHDICFNTSTHVAVEDGLAFSSHNVEFLSINPVLSSYSLSVPEAAIVWTGEDPFIFYEKLPHSYSACIAFFPNPVDAIQDLAPDTHLTQDTQAHVEQPSFFPKKTFLFYQTPRCDTSPSLHTNKVGAPSIPTHAVTSPRQRIGFVSTAHFQKTPLSPEAHIAAAPLNNKESQPHAVDITLSPESSTEYAGLYRMHPRAYPAAFELDNEHGYVASHTPFSPKKQRYCREASPAFVDTVTALPTPYVRNTPLPRVRAPVGEPKKVVEKPLEHLTSFEESTSTPLTFNEPHTQLACHVPDDCITHLSVPYASAAPTVLPLPHAQDIGTQLNPASLSSRHAVEEMSATIDFGTHLGKACNALFPQQLPSMSAHTIPVRDSLQEGTPKLQGRPIGIAYDIDDAKHVNDGYRLTSYNLTRIPTPDALNIDEYMEHLSTHVEVIPRNDNDGYYFSLTLSPDHPEGLTKTTQNVVYFVDRTSSILAPRYDAYRNGVLRSLQYLQEGDTFNIVVIDAKLNFFEEQAVPVTRSSIRRARRFLKDLPFSKIKRTRVDLYDLLYELVDYFPENGNANTAILVSDGLSLFDVDHKADTLRKILSKNQGNVTLHCASAGGKNNASMLDLISHMHSGEFVYSHSVASFPRKLARLIKKSNGLLASNLHLTTLQNDHTLDVDLFATNETTPHLYTGKPLTLYGSINRLEDFDLVIQGKVGNRFMHYAKKISFSNAKKSPPHLYRFVAINKAYSCYDLFLKKRDPMYLKEAKSLLQKYKLPSATKRKAATNHKNLMRERLDLF